MKITQKGPDTREALRPAAGPDSRPAPPAVPAAGGADSIQLSHLSTQLATHRALAGEAPVNIENLERIKQAIKNGEFTVNAETVADKLLEIARDDLITRP